ncbi:MAG: cadherin repeat domain-containing protein, partial [Hydrogenophaga sp.]
MSASGRVYISVLNVNNPPVLLPAQRGVDERSPGGTPVGAQLRGADQVVAYSISDGDGAGVFAIHPATG